MSKYDDVRHAVPQPGQLRVAKGSIRVYTCKVPGVYSSMLQVAGRGDPLFVVGFSADTRMLAVLTARGIGESFYDSLLFHSDPQ